MAFYTQKEFAELTGKTAAHISTYIKRGIIVRSGKHIDSGVRENADFMQKCGVTDGAVIAAAPARISPAENVKPDRSKQRQREPLDEKPPEYNGGQYEADLIKKNADIEYKEAQTRLLLLKEAQMRGEQIPVTLVKEVISQLSRAIISSYKDSADALLIDISHRTKMSKEDSAMLKGELVTLINKAHDKAIDQAIAAIKNVVKEFKSTEDE